MTVQYGNRIRVITFVMIDAQMILMRYGMDKCVLKTILINARKLVWVMDMSYLHSIENKSKHLTADASVNVKQ